MQAILATCLAIGCGSDTARPPEESPRLAVGLELRESPLLDTLLGAFAAETGVRASVLSSPEVADVLLLAPSGEPNAAAASLVRDGHDVCWTSYVLLGPPADAERSYGEFNYQSWARGRSPLGSPGPVAGSSASRLFQEIALSAFPFVSRGDGSENHLLEIRFWGPRGPSRGLQRKDFKVSSYHETREPMPRTLAVADEASAYTLCDLATYLRMRKRIRLAIVLARDSELRTSYRVTLVDPRAESSGRSRAARRLYDWLASESCRATLKNVRVDGERPFYAPGEDLDAALRGRLDPEEQPADDEEDGR